MPVPISSSSPGRAAGYEALIERYRLDVIANWHRSYVAAGATQRVEMADDQVVEMYPGQYWPGDSAGDHLEFALKYDGTNPGILHRLFETIPPAEVVDYVRSKPMGKYARRIWFLYEFLTGRKLPLPDLTQGNYVDVLDADKYYANGGAEQVRRQRINNNLPGVSRFCPLIRRTDALRQFEAANVADRCRAIASSYPPDILKRALAYLYTKETRSSFEIERESPGAARTQRFAALLQLAETEDFCRKSRLIELQNRTVDKRFREADYRSRQNYVGEAIAWQRQQVHYVPPRPEDVADLMEGLIAAHHRMERGGLPAFVHAAAISYGFVFVHPFEDGNGRIHRFLIHNILARRGLTPGGMMFPVSAAMLTNAAQYDASLEAFSRPLMTLVEYDLDRDGRMTVLNDVSVCYRYMDMTPQAEALCRFIEQTVETELVEELAFLAHYDKARLAIRDIVDMPDRDVDLFIRLCVGNGGRLARRKRGLFRLLSDDEVARMEHAVQSGYPHLADAGDGDRLASG